MQITSPSPTHANGQTKDPAGSALTLLEALTTTSIRPPQPEERSTSPHHFMRFLRECDSKLITCAATELSVAIRNGDWLPFERAVIRRLEPLRHDISKTILAALGNVVSDSAHSSIFHGGYQIHLDTMCCFWLGHPETKAHLEELVSQIVSSAPPFQDPQLNTVATHAMVHCIATGTLDLPHFVYSHLSPDFVTIACSAAVRAEASRHLTSQDRTRTAR